LAPVLLFDIDGTLVSAGGAGSRSLEQGLARHLEPLAGPRARWLDGMRLDGMTDRLIVRQAMAAAGLAFDDGLCDRVLASYLEFLVKEIEGPGYRVLPGVAELLDALSARGAVLGLCTGNVQSGARIKLARGGLDRHFGFGEQDINGFADDGEARERIVEAALRRASARLGRPVEPAQALVIGDTPRDVDAARRAGVPVLAVATGRFSLAELAAHGADHAVPTLEGALELLLGWPPARTA
jgi:phosphoglycolate phosphatase-like HAD superfamily hydrolase